MMDVKIVLAVLCSHISMFDRNRESNPQYAYFVTSGALQVMWYYVHTSRVFFYNYIDHVVRERLHTTIGQWKLGIPSEIMYTH
jgi:hypothetical protein